MRYGNDYYLAPSGVQKERITAEDLFVMRLPDAESKAAGAAEVQVLKDLALVEVARPPPEKKFTPSQCTPLFFNAFSDRHAFACIHTHSQAAVLVTLLFDKEFRITHQEMIKGIRKGSTKENFKYFDMLTVPIIENTPEEKDLTDRMRAAMKEYPETNAVLVRRHGVYVWGENWQKAKTMCECYDYLFEIAVQMKQIGLDCSEIPEASEYRHEMVNPQTKNQVGNSEVEQQKRKRAKIEEL